MADTIITATVWPSQNNVGGGKKLNEPMVSAAFRAFAVDSSVLSGFGVPSESDPQLTIASGEAVINGYRVYMSDPSIVECSEDVDNYVFIKLLKDGLGQVANVAFEVNSTGIAPADSLPICMTTPSGTGSVYTSPIMMGSQLTVGGRYAVIAGVIQHTANGWRLKNDSNHRPINIKDAYDDDSFECIYIDYDHLDVANVVSMVVTPGLGLAEDGVAVGVTADSNNATITFSGARAGGYVEFSQASGVPVIHSGYGLTGITLDDPFNLPRFFIDHYAAAGEAALISPYDGYTVLPTVASMTAKQTELTVAPGTDYHFYFLRESVGVITPSLLELNREITVLGIVELNR